MPNTMFNKQEYLMNREALVNELTKNNKDTININQTLVSQQAYSYDLAVAQRFKKIAKEQNLGWKDLTIAELRQGGRFDDNLEYVKGKKVDVSGINDELNEMSDEEREALFAALPAGIKHTNQGYISYEVFGSD